MNIPPKKILLQHLRGHKIDWGHLPSSLLTPLTAIDFILHLAKQLRQLDFEEFFRNENEKTLFKVTSSLSFRINN